MKQSVPALLLGSVLLLAGLMLLSAWERHIGGLYAQLDLQTAAAFETGKVWKDRYEQAVEDAAIDDRVASINQGGADRSQATADSLQAVIDSLPSLADAATAQDSITHLRMELTFSNQRNEAQHATSDSLRNVILLVTKDRNRWRGIADEARHVTIPALEKALKDEHNARQCRILGFISCPSRGTVAVIAGGVGLAAGLFATR